MTQNDLDTMGGSWRLGLRTKSLIPNQLPDPDEEYGARFFDHLKFSVIPSCINDAVQGGSTEIVLDAPLDALTTRAFEGFISWARLEDMDARFGGVVFGENGSKGCRGVIRLTVRVKV